MIVIVVDLLSDGLVASDTPTWLNFYMLISGLYFATNPQGLVRTRWQERFVRLLFPGAFVTTLLPVYTLVFLLATSGWF
jgi:hypothetical protein